MKKDKKFIWGIGIANLVTFIFLVIIYNLQYKYLTINNVKEAISLIIFTFLPFYLSFFMLRTKKLDKKFYIGFVLFLLISFVYLFITEERFLIFLILVLLPFYLSLFIIRLKSLEDLFHVRFVLFCIISIVYLVAIGWSYSAVLESSTSNVKNYLIVDNGLKDIDLSIFPKNISKNAKNVKYNYYYHSFLDSDFDFYLEIELPEEEYNQEKERIKNIDYLEKMDYVYYSNSSEEYIETNGYDKINGFVINPKYQYRFVSFFDSENKIVYIFSDGYMKPYFIENRENNIKCESGYCKISN